MNETTQQEKTTQLSSRNEQLNSAAGTKQLNSTVGTKQLNSFVEMKQLNSALPSTAYNCLHRLYSRIGFFYLLSLKMVHSFFHKSQFTTQTLLLVRPCSLSPQNALKFTLIWINPNHSIHFLHIRNECKYVLSKANHY
ncbi:hypothetical protein TNCV_1281561 [Trichonephila clavipes]|nr:hypothetical protein TNCV_1281561 [Trichonephila clavipes]